MSEHRCHLSFITAADCPLELHDRSEVGDDGLADRSEVGDDWLADRSEVEVLPDGMAERSVGLVDCSDEILLNILLHVPPQDLLLNVARVSKRLHALSRDRSLTSHISLSEQYTVCDEHVRSLLRCVRPQLLSLDLAGCYWLSSACVSEAWACGQLRRLDVSGCPMPAGRLAKLLSGLAQLTELALDVGGRGLDLRALSAEARATLARLRVLTQTLLVPSYGVLPLCPQLTRLQLRLEVAGTGAGMGAGTPGEGGVELAVGQSSVPHYQSLNCLDARLAPGAANRTLLALLLAPLSVRPITRLKRLLLSAPGPAPPRPPALNGLLDSLGEGLAEGGGASTTVLQLPGSWLDEQALRRVLSRGCPAYLSLARGGPSPCLPDYNLRPLRSLNLSGCGQELDSDWLRALCESSPLLRHLNLSGMHYHHHGDGGARAETHPCSSLAKLPHLLSLALSVCAVAEGNGTSPSPPETSPLLGLRKARRVGVETYRPGSEVTEGVSCLRRLLMGCSRLQQLELAGAEFVSATPRYEAPIRKQAAGCACACSVGEVAVATLALRPSLRSLTLAAMPGLQTGASLCQLTQCCANLRNLSLANLGTTHSVCYTHTLLQALPHCQHLRDLRYTHTHTHTLRLLHIHPSAGSAALPTPTRPTVYTHTHTHTLRLLHTHTPSATHTPCCRLCRTANAYETYGTHTHTPSATHTHTHSVCYTHTHTHSVCYTHTQTHTHPAAGSTALPAPTRPTGGAALL
ncbi:F-box/LRR-repeat protein 18 isoform X1 [Alosa sapidissima]|uniref:F-box/LRR-repeat protein 18 isoform X1 n=1 Tax=Alosa sapidissima TaxID=34773 RepID=UPI001C083CC8|nr:F-box/LRR-repeat protein 18 isoform X1 [Alosa sapidissima]